MKKWQPMILRYIGHVADVVMGRVAGRRPRVPRPPLPCLLTTERRVPPLEAGVGAAPGVTGTGRAESDSGSRRSGVLFAGHRGGRPARSDWRGLRVGLGLRSRSLDAFSRACSVSIPERFSGGHGVFGSAEADPMEIQAEFEASVAPMVLQAAHGYEGPPRKRDPRTRARRGRLLRPFSHRQVNDRLWSRLSVVPALGR